MRKHTVWGRVSAMAFATVAMILGVALCVSAAPATSALAANNTNTITAEQAAYMPDVFLGLFARSDADRTNQIVSSTDGVNFELVNSILKDAHPYTVDDDRLAVQDNGVDLSIPLDRSIDRPYTLNTHWCPSFMYYDGCFWSIVNASWNAGAYDMRAEFSINYSYDLIHWSDSQVCYATLPADTPRDRFWGDAWTSVVAAEFALAPDNTPYIMMSVGTYGAYSGHPTEDSCWPVLFKVNELKPLADPAYNPCGYNLDFNADAGQWINLPSQATDFIDGSMYFDGDTCYLSMKANGLYPEIWSCGSYTNLARSWDKGVWHLCSDVKYGNEAESMTKMGSTYYMYTDKIAGVSENRGQSGTVVQTSSSPYGGWSGPQNITVRDVYGNILSVTNQGDAFDGPRHGSVITITDPQVKAVVYNARARMGFGTWVWDDARGAWRYQFGDGSYARGGWGFYTGHWEYFTDDGYALSNTWSLINGDWYYFDSACYMVSGIWAWIGNAWYGFWANGAMCRGWVWDSGYNNYFYCDPVDGHMYTSCWAWINGDWYGFWASGTMCCGWIWDGAWYYCDWNNGYMYRNRWVSNTWWWADASGVCRYAR